jgi:hypothetical protein
MTAATAESARIRCDRSVAFRQLMGARSARRVGRETALTARSFLRRRTRALQPTRLVGWVGRVRLAAARLPGRPSRSAG